MIFIIYNLYIYIYLLY